MKLGPLRHPKFARSPETLKENAKDTSSVIKELLGNLQDSPDNVYQKYWYALQTVKAYVKDAEDNLLEDLKHLGVCVPEQFDFSVLSKPKKPRLKRKK